MSKEHEEVLKKALNLAKEDEILNAEEMSATEGGSNISLGDCGEKNYGNCVAGCACPVLPSKADKAEDVVL